MAEHADVVVIGGGVMGLAAARALAQAGRAVTVLERLAIGHPSGSSHGSARIFRLAYPDPVFVRMGREARVLWDEVSDGYGHPLIRETGEISVGADLERLAASMRAGGAQIDVVTPDAVTERFPALRFEGMDWAIFEPGAGVISAARALEAFRRGAVEGGAIIREETPVTSLRVDGDDVVLTTADAQVRARVAVVAAGSWSRALLAGASIDLPTFTRVETVGFFDGPGGDLPVILEWGDPAITYMLPTPEGHLKAAEHLGGPRRDPDEPGPPDVDSMTRIGSWLRSRVPDASPEALYGETCLYTMTDDERFIIERHGPIIVASACSGHGFKFAPWVGARVASLALGHDGRAESPGRASR